MLVSRHYALFYGYEHLPDTASSTDTEPPVPGSARTTAIMHPDLIDPLLLFSPLWSATRLGDHDPTPAQRGIECTKTFPSVQDWSQFNGGCWSQPATADMRTSFAGESLGAILLRFRVIGSQTVKTSNCNVSGSC